MSLRAKLATTIAALCMVICLLTVGVWAASRTSVGFSGTVSFTSKDVNATITGTITGATGAQNVTNTPVATFNGSEAEPAEGEYTPAQAWTIGNLDFATKDSEIVITLNIKNDNTERAIQIDSFTAKLGTQDLTAVEGDEETVDGSNVIAWISTAATTNQQIAASGSTTVAITLKIANNNYKVDASKAAFSAELKLSNVPA